MDARYLQEWLRELEDELGVLEPRLRALVEHVRLLRNAADAVRALGSSSLVAEPDVDEIRLDPEPPLPEHREAGDQGGRRDPQGARRDPVDPVVHRDLPDPPSRRQAPPAPRPVAMVDPSVFDPLPRRAGGGHPGEARNAAGHATEADGAVR